MIFGWRETVKLEDVFHNNDYTFEERKHLIIKRIRESNWDFHSKNWDTVDEALNRLSDAADVQQFDAGWVDIYDYADQDRIWIATF